MQPDAAASTGAYQGHPHITASTVGTTELGGNEHCGEGQRPPRIDGAVIRRHCQVALGWEQLWDEAEADGVLSGLRSGKPHSRGQQASKAAHLVEPRHRCHPGSQVLHALSVTCTWKMATDAMLGGIAEPLTQVASCLLSRCRMRAVHPATRAAYDWGMKISNLRFTLEAAIVRKLHRNMPPLSSLGRSTLSARKPTGIRATAYRTCTKLSLSPERDRSIQLHTTDFTVIPSVARVVQDSMYSNAASGDDF